MKKISTAHLALLAMFFSWGTGFVVTKIALLEMPPMLLNGLRFLVSGVLIMAYCLARRMEQPQTKLQWTRITISSALSIIGGNFFLTIALINMENGGIAPVITSLESSIFIIACFIVGEKFHRSVWVGMVVGFCGLLVMFWPAVNGLIGGESEEMKNYAFALFFLLLTACCWGVGAYYMRHHEFKCPILVFSAWQYLIGCVLFLVISAFRDPWDLSNFSPTTWGAFAYVVIITTVIGYGSFVYVLQYLPANVVATKAYVIPVISIATGILLRGETLTTLQIIGTLIILAGVVMVNLRKGPSSSSTPPLPTH